jgi:8-oxo-dGTP pyrophosphatase MutT (NUDIX family)
MPFGLHQSLLRVFGRLPTQVRRWIVRFLSPSYTVGAIAIIERSDGSILLVRQAYRTRWGVPGGLLKRGEDPASGAAREVMEEVGLAVEFEGEPAPVVDPDPQRVDLVFRARPAAGIDPDRAVPCSPEIEEVGWFAPDALPELQPETAQALVALARSARSPQAHRLSDE